MNKDGSRCMYLDSEILQFGMPGFYNRGFAHKSCFKNLFGWQRKFSNSKKKALGRMLFLNMF